MLDVKHIFPTIQGEGPFVGVPAVFLRLGGCNLACSFCDTDFEDFTSRQTDEVIQEIGTLAHENGKRVRALVVITGGEPMRQPIEYLCNELIGQGYSVQIETNGTLFRQLHEKVNIVCSPKVSNEQYHPIRPDLLQRIDALKFIVSAHNDNYRAVGEVGQGQINIPVYVQPMDEHDPKLNAENMAHAVALVNKHGYRLSIQTHKILGIE